MSDTDIIVLSFGGLALLAIGLFYLVAYRLERLLDRYRIKYGFDKDIELKEISSPNNIDRREKAYKKRTFKD